MPHIRHVTKWSRLGTYSTSTKLFDKDERGHSYNMLLKYKNIPIFYSPFISYPLTDKRQSGILTPSFGSSGDSGTALSVPYYFNLAKNYDATVKWHPLVIEVYYLIMNLGI